MSLIAAQAGHEGVHGRQVVSLNVVHPLLELVGAQFADHLSERPDMPGEVVQLRAPVQNLLEMTSLLSVQVAWLSHDPGGDMPDLELGGRRVRSSEGGAERAREPGCSHSPLADE